MDDLRARLVEVVEGVVVSGVSQLEISRRAGHSEGWVADLLRGWRGRGSRRGAEPTIPTLRSLAMGLGIDLKDLLVRVGVIS